MPEVQEDQHADHGGERAPHGSERVRFEMGGDEGPMMFNPPNAMSQRDRARNCVVEVAIT
jgi:hypothetical protein